MAKIAVIKDPVDATAILRHLNLWEEPPARGSPAGGTVYEPCYDDLPAADCGPAEQPDPPAASDEQVFPDYDHTPDPEPVYDSFMIKTLRTGLAPTPPYPPAVHFGAPSGPKKAGLWA